MAISGLDHRLSQRSISDKFMDQSYLIWFRRNISHSVEYRLARRDATRDHKEPRRSHKVAFDINVKRKRESPSVLSAERAYFTVKDASRFDQACAIGIGYFQEMSFR